MIRQATIVTGNQHKLAQWRRIFPAHITLDSTDIDLTEIQSMDAHAIVEDKVRRAYETVGKPVIVEDISASIDKLNGLPGPFIKFFEDRLGKDALYTIAGGEEMATVSCIAAYYDGERLVTGTGIVHGKVVPARGDNGFGFDYVFVPSGQDKTYAEMTHEEKDAISHRHLAIEDLLSKLQAL